VRSLPRPRLLAATTLMLALGGATAVLAAAQVDDHKGGQLKASRSASDQHDVILGSKDSAQPQTMGDFLTAVTKDVDAYWTKVFADSGLSEPRVSYAWIPAGQTVASACGDGSGTAGENAAAYCQADDTIYISEQFASEIYDGELDQALPGSSQGYGKTLGDFAVAYIVAHEYGHQIQDELGAFEKYGNQVPTMNFELQADCYRRRWTPPLPWATSTRRIPLTTARPSSARPRGTPASSPATRRPASAT
jgi:uncharacterized protein